MCTALNEFVNCMKLVNPTRCKSDPFYRNSARQPDWEHRRAFVLAEALVSLLAGILFLLSMAVIFVTSSVSFASLGSYINTDRPSRNALDHMPRNIRRAKLLTPFTPALLVFNYDATVNPGTNLTYRYDTNAAGAIRVDVAAQT